MKGIKQKISRYWGYFIGLLLKRGSVEDIIITEVICNSLHAGFMQENVSYEKVESVAKRTSTVLLDIMKNIRHFNNKYNIRKY